MVEENANLKWKTCPQKTNNDTLNEETWICFPHMRSINVRIFGPMIQEVALKFSKSYGNEEFNASSG